MIAVKNKKMTTKEIIKQQKKEQTIQRSGEQKRSQ